MASPTDYMGMVDELLELEDGLSDWEIRFLEDLKSREASILTPRQFQLLETLWGKKFRL